MEPILFAAFGILAVAALLTAFLKSGPARAVTLLAVLSSASVFIVVALGVLVNGAPLRPIVLWEPKVINAALSVRVDVLGAFFLLVIGLVAVPATWFSMAYTRKMGEATNGFFPLFLLFILGMAGVVVVDDFFFFFVPWEFMALSSYGLVIFHKERQENLDAGFKYFFLTHLGTAALFFGVTLLVLSGGGSFQFSAIARSLPDLLNGQPALTHGALLLILLGFLVKAGGFPFGMWWLPDAHPAAPSPVSALLSGVMIKLGLYGILRVFFGLLPPGPWNVAWGLILALFGTFSLFFGTLSALIQHDSKRLLAYHSIGQVGYMLLGFGIGLAYIETNPAIAALGLIGGLFHLLNHACFKGLLFLNAGSFEYTTGERDLNLLGGLGKLLPLTAVTTVVASMSIAGLPPFNGFASKWILYHASLWGTGDAGLVFIFCGLAALFISAVTLASFLKFMGATLWGPPSPLVLKSKAEAEGLWLGSGQLFLALLCLVLGLLPQAGVWLCYQAAAGLAPQASWPAFTGLFGESSVTLAIVDQGALVGLWSPVIASLLLAACFLLALGIRRLAKAPMRAVAPWSCGSRVESEQLRFKAAHYYTPFKSFVHLLMPEWKPAWRPKRWPIVTQVLDLDAWLYRPFVQGLLRLFSWVARSHVGISQVYALWLVIGFCATCLFFFLY